MSISRGSVSGLILAAMTSLVTISLAPRLLSRWTPNHIGSWTACTWACLAICFPIPIVETFFTSFKLTIVLLRQPLSLSSLAQFVQRQMGDVTAALYHLRSVIIHPSNDHQAPRRIYHVWHSETRLWCRPCARYRISLHSH